MSDTFYILFVKIALPQRMGGRKEAWEALVVCERCGVRKVQDSYLLTAVESRIVI